MYSIFFCFCFFVYLFRLLQKNITDRRRFRHQAPPAGERLPPHHALRLLQQMLPGRRWNDDPEEQPGVRDLVERGLGPTSRYPCLRRDLRPAQDGTRYVWFQYVHYYHITTRVGWKVHRLTMKKLCHCSETWHALNSTFSDTKSNCIISFQINDTLDK